VGTVQRPKRQSKALVLFAIVLTHFALVLSSQQWPPAAPRASRLLDDAAKSSSENILSSSPADSSVGVVYFDPLRGRCRSVSGERGAAVPEPNSPVQERPRHGAERRVYQGEANGTLPPETKCLQTLSLSEPTESSFSSTPTTLHPTPTPRATPSSSSPQMRRRAQSCKDR